MLQETTFDIAKTVEFKLVTKGLFKKSVVRLKKLRILKVEQFSCKSGENIKNI